MDETKKVKKIDRKVFLSEKAMIRSILIIGMFVYNVIIISDSDYAIYPVFETVMYTTGIGISLVLYDIILSGFTLANLDLSMIVAIVLLIALIMLVVFFPPAAESMQKAIQKSIAFWFWDI